MAEAVPFQSLAWTTSSSCQCRAGLNSTPATKDQSLGTPELAAQNFGLAFEAFKNSFAGMEIRRGGFQEVEIRRRPRFRLRSRGIELVFKPQHATLNNFEPRLNERGLLPFCFVCQRGKCGDALREAAQVGNECRREVRKRNASRP